MDAQEIKAAGAHHDAQRALTEAPFVNRTDPAQAARSRWQARRQPPGPDLGGRPRREVERLAVAAQPPGQRSRGDRADPATSPTRSGTGLSATDKFRVDITPYFISLIDPDDPDDPIRRQVIPLGREHQAFTAMMEDSLAEDRHSPVPGPRPSLPGSGAHARHDPVRELLPVLHPVAHRRRPDPELQLAATTRRSSSTCAGRRRSATS